MTDDITTETVDTAHDLTAGDRMTTPTMDEFKTIDAVDTHRRVWVYFEDGSREALNPDGTHAHGDIERIVSEDS